MGEPAAYLEKQLKAFRQGTRTREMMSVVAKSLDDQSIADLPAWSFAHKVETALPAGVSVDDAPQACTACHGAEGVGQLGNVPNLASESAIYIDTQLKAFRLGKRTDDVMSAIAADLTTEEIRAHADRNAAIELNIIDAH
ncbi:c-type cytochrome [Stappia stellulata]|uniref:c-type cytochrome n=1 Tax=Stappia stellulata TaxID=71235 RepID=UPI0003FE6456|nr:c-type cytochrome [Stappia stellulata]